MARALWWSRAMSRRADLMAKCFAVLAAVAWLAACGGSDAPAPVPDPVQSAAAEHEHDSPAPTPAAEQPPKVPLLEQELAYGEAQRRNLVGFLAMPRDAAEPLPGV